MCGLLCVVSRPSAFDRPTVEEALDTLTHRGPDGSGLELLRVSGWDVWLGHRRLAIVDLSDDGAQPFHIRGEHEASIIFNGEVYNHRALRRESKATFRSTSDTEVLLHGLMKQGGSFLKRVNGMFGFVCADVSQKQLILGRDRVGKKPLYVYQTDEVMAVASELKALIALGLPVSINQAALASFRWLGYITGPSTIYQEIQKFPAATSATVNLRSNSLALEYTRFWDPLTSFGQVYSGTYTQALDDLEELIDDSVKLRLDADVSVGAFLSGGIDSSLVVASLSKSRRDTLAMTVRLDDASLDESAYAQETGRQLGIKVTTLDVDISADDSSIAWSFDEPFADISQVPTLAIAQAARKHVKCVLTGDGGDEIFLGYPWLTYPERLFAWRGILPQMVATQIANLIESPLGHEVVGGLAGLAGLNIATTKNKVKMIRDVLTLDNPEGLYDLFKAQQHRDFLPTELSALLPKSLADCARSSNPTLSWESLQGRSLAEYLGAVDFLTFLQDDVLVKVDRGTMAYGLEARAPLLDYRIIEFAHSLPLSFKISDGVYKKILRDLLSRSIGGEVLSRPKQGFGIPVPPDLPSAATPSAAWAVRMEAAWRKQWLDPTDK